MPTSSSDRRQAGRGLASAPCPSCSGASACATTGGHANGLLTVAGDAVLGAPALAIVEEGPLGRTMAATSIPEQELHLVAPRQPVAAHVRDIWRFRELLRNLVRKELKVRYKNSVLGFVWSMINPLFLLTVYGIVFNILGNSFDYFTIWLLIGLLCWNLFGSAVVSGTSSIT